MTYREILAKSEETNYDAEIALGRMMDIVEEQTGEWPNWGDQAPQWIVEQFGFEDEDDGMYGYGDGSDLLAWRNGY